MNRHRHGSFCSVNKNQEFPTNSSIAILFVFHPTHPIGLQKSRFLRKPTNELLFHDSENFQSLREKNMIHELSHLANGPASSKVTIADGFFRHFLSFLVLSPLLTTRKQKERRKKFFQFSIPEKAFGMEGRPKESEALELAKLFSRIWMVKGHV